MEKLGGLMLHWQGRGAEMDNAKRPVSDQPTWFTDSDSLQVGRVNPLGQIRPLVQKEQHLAMERKKRR